MATRTESIQLEPSGQTTPYHSGPYTPGAEEAGDFFAGQEVTSLPPVDGGKDAWLFLSACFMMEALVWGFPFSFGVFQNYYGSHPPFQGSSNLTVIGTCSMGLMYLTAPITFGVCRLFVRWARWTPMLGLLVMCISLAGASFSTTVPQLIATQGILYALGGGIAYAPCILFLDEWFVKRKGLAYGIMWSGTGIAGVVLPLLLDWLLERFGYKATLRMWAVVLFLLTAPLVCFVKPRLPHRGAQTAKPFNLRFLALPTFLLYEVANIAEATGFFLPGIYVPTYARQTLHAHSVTSAITVLLLNVSSVFGCVAMGWFTDRFHVSTCIMLSTLGATIGVFCIWGFSSSLPVLYLFCVLYGLFAGSYTSTWPGVMREVIDKGTAQSEKYGYVDSGMVFGWLAAGRGVGNVISGPLSEGLMKWYPWQGEAALAYGSRYGTLIVFTGVTALLGGSSFFLRRARFL